jgi:hypothetical protein
MHKAADLMVSRGLTVKESSGYETRGRPYTFYGNAGLICHHTAATSDIDSVLINGRSDLPGPLCHYALHKNGDVVLIAAGYANHAGESLPGAPTNSTGWGIEATGPIPLDGYGPGAFPNYEEYQVMVGCILDAESWSKDKIWFHKTSCSPKGRKIDPSFDYDSFCAGVGSGLEDELSAEAERQINEIYQGLVVPGTTTVAQAFELLFNRVKAIEDALKVPGTQTVQQSVEILYRRVQKVEDGVKLQCDQMGIPFDEVDTSTITG